MATRFLASSRCLVLASFMFFSVSASAQGALDGQTFSVSVDGSEHATGDTLSFADGMFLSGDCVQYGFAAGAYEVVQAEGSADVQFTVESTSAEEGSMVWTGTISGDSISGTTTWTKEGQDPVSYTFSGMASSLVDGRTFDVRVTGEDYDSPDVFVFTDGTFESTDCQQYGFGSGMYALSGAEGGYIFMTTTHSEAEGQMAWTGTISGDLVEGSVVWSKEGQDAVTYTFAGQATGTEGAVEGE